MNKATTIQAEWIELGFEPSQPDENGWIDFDFLPETFDMGNLDIKQVEKTLMVRPKALRNLTKKIYIAGKVTGEPPHKTVLKFAMAKKEIEAMGFEALNPIDLVMIHMRDNQISYHTETQEEIWNIAMKVCIKALIDCDGLVILPCWQDSKGAKIERQLADDLGITIVNHTPFGLKVLKQNLS